MTTWEVLMIKVTKPSMIGPLILMLMLLICASRCSADGCNCAVSILDYEPVYLVPGDSVEARTTGPIGNYPRISFTDIHRCVPVRAKRSYTWDFIHMRFYRTDTGEEFPLGIWVDGTYYFHYNFVVSVDPSAPLGQYEIDWQICCGGQSLPGCDGCMVGTCHAGLGPVAVTIIDEVPSLLRIPHDVLTVQAAVDSAVPGDTIVVDPGTYYEYGIIWPGWKDDICLRSATGDPQSVVIDAQGLGFVMHAYRPEGCRINGITFTGGADFGVRLSECSSFLIENCMFVENSGYGVYCNGNAGDPMSYGGTMCNCTVAYNSGNGIGVIRSHLTMERCIVAGNVGEAVAGPWCYVTASCCDFYGNAGGDWGVCVAGPDTVLHNLSADPRFCHPENKDFRIDESSPCASDNSPNGCGLIGAQSVGCANSGVPEDNQKGDTWGQIKARFRDE